MALVSPGVEVTIIDQSQYLPAAQNSVPLVVVATAQNKANPTGTGVAQATTAANAGKLYLVTSQRDLVTLYGNPFFYTTTNGTPIQGYELNEYGLLAAYSTLGVTNRAYILRADIDLASLVGKTSRPVGQPSNGTYWLDTSSTTWGIYEFNATTGKFTNKVPYVITNANDLVGGYPSQTIGNIGEYAVNALDNSTTNPVTGNSTYFFKNSNNQWVKLGSSEWRMAWPTAQGSQSNPTLTANDTATFTWTASSGQTVTWTVTVPDQGAGTSDLAGFVTAFNSLNMGEVTASVVNGKFTIFTDGTYQNTRLSITASTGTVLDDLGLALGNYNSPGLQYGTSAQMPLWTTNQSQPHPTGSVWLKVGAAGTGLTPSVLRYSTNTSSWQTKTVGLYRSDWQANAELDSSGGQAIPAGTIYCQYNYDGNTLNSEAPINFFERSTLGATTITGTVTTPDLSSGPYTLDVLVSQPGTNSLSSTYTVYINDNATVDDIIVAWTTANIPYTMATMASNGALSLTHTEGGVILLSDFNTTTGYSNGLLNALGITINTTDGCKYGPSVPLTFNNVSGTTETGVGAGATFSVLAAYGHYYVNQVFASAGSGYAPGNLIKISGTSLGGTTPENDLVLTVVSVSAGAITGVAVNEGSPAAKFYTQISNWYPLEYTAKGDTPDVAPANNTNWFYSVENQVDIMVNYNGQWFGYRNKNYDENGFPISGTNTTDPNGPICMASQPTTQSDGTPLVNGDLWIDTSDLENYPVIYRYVNAGTATATWTLIDTTDQIGSTGIVFADARWATNGSTSPYDDAIPTIKSLLTSDYLDLDAPSPALYPSGMLLWNTRRSGYNVKQYKVNYFNTVSFPDSVLPAQTDAWVTVSGNQANGAMYAGRKAQRNMVVKAMASVIDTNTSIRDEDNYFNLIAAPNYPEVQPNMVVLNADRGETGYIVGDTPMRLAESATDIQAWATNANGASSTGEEGLVTRNTYMGLFYPSGLASDLSGNQVAVPASHMMLRTIIRNDSVAYPWFAPAGTRRGTIDNALSIGYLDSTSGEFVPTKTRIGIRDVLYTNFINPMVYFTGNGLLNYGNKTSYDSQSALDRINVARLVAYIRRQLTIAARPFVFEPNDQLTRQQIQGVIQTLFVDLVAKRGVYDYLVVCDESNNTPARIDRNELWVDVAIEPVKAAEFIYIPVRVLNTGELASL